MMSRKTGPRLMVLSLLVIGAAIGPATGQEFTDVPKWHWAWAYIQGARDAGVTTGYDDGSYQPSVTVGRDQMAVFIARAMCAGDANVPDGPETASFPDVPNTGYGADGTDPFWAYKYIEYVVANDVTVGYEDGLYHPDREVTRGQMAAFVARAMCGGEEYVPDPSGSPRFPDVTEAVNSWCYKHVEYIAGEGVTLGYPDGLYHPEVACSRDQMAVYLCRAFDLPVPPQPYNITDYFPLTEGSSWTYESGDGVHTKTISGSEELWGQSYARMVSEEGSTDLWRAAPEALYLGGLDYGESGTLTFDPAYQIANGLGVGQLVDEQESTAYSGPSPAGTAWFDYYFVDVEDVTVPAGTFENCMKLRIQFQLMDQQDQQFYIWVARGVGMVKMDSGPFGGDEWEVLVSADVNGVSYPANGGPFHLADYRPLDVGGTLVYTGSDGASIDQIVGVDAVGGIEAARVDSGPAEGRPSCAYLAVIDGALCYVGGYDAGSGDTVTLVPPLAFPATASAGDHGSANGQAYVGDNPVGAVTLEWAVVGAGPVSVEAGEFDNAIKLRVRVTDPSSGVSESYLWLALGVGLVKEDARSFGAEAWRELTSAKVLGVEYPIGDRLFDITDYVDLTVGNEWTYGADSPVTYSVTAVGPDWAAVNGGGFTYHLSADELGFSYHGKGWARPEPGSATFDPPLLIENSLAQGEGGEQTSLYSEPYSPVGDAQFEYTFDGIEAVSTQAGLFSDCMKISYSLDLPYMPTGAAQTGTRWFARGVGLVQREYGSTVSQLTQASVAGVSYPPGETEFTVTDYLPVELGDRWAEIHQGESWYGASTIIVDGTPYLSGLPIADTVYKFSRYDGDGYDGSDLMAIRSDGIGIYGFVDPSEGPMVVNPPLVIPNGGKVGDSGGGTTTMYAWVTDHWQSVGSTEGFWGLVDAGAITTSAGHFGDCLLIRWGANIPSMGEMVNFAWYARGVGVVKRYELGDASWEELMGATIGEETIPAVIAPATPVDGSIPQGASIGFDFSAGGAAAQPDDQDLSYIYNGGTDAFVQSFDTRGVSRFIGYGQYDFESMRAYSTFLPPEWDIWGPAWAQQGWVLYIGGNAVEDSLVVKTREGRYALVHITGASAGQLDIEYVYPYGFFE